MKLIQKSAMLIVVFSILVLSSCHRSGCPGQITDAPQFEQTLDDDNC